MTRLSVNINKIALLRNSRGADMPNLLQVALDCEEFGAQGITVHPRPDQRHIKYADLPVLKQNISTEFNIEGYPSRDFIDVVLANKPDQVTLVPDPPGVLTSSEGWDTIAKKEFLKDVISEFKSEGMRVSIFLNPEINMVTHSVETGTDRIEFYTGDYAKNYTANKEKAILPFVEASKIANELGLGVNAGHDLNLGNLNYFYSNIPGLLEVSIGHAIICDALYFGFKNVIQMYLQLLSYKV